jgi:hypothetical protein
MTVLKTKRAEVVGDDGGEETSTITATLLHGKQYQFNDNGKYYIFQRAVPVSVPAAVADKLEEMVRPVKIDGEEYERELFEIDRNAPRRNVQEDADNKKPRFKLVRVEAKKPKPRPLPTGVGGLRRTAR